MIAPKGDEAEASHKTEIRTCQEMSKIDERHAIRLLIKKTQSKSRAALRDAQSVCFKHRRDIKIVRFPHTSLATRTLPITEAFLPYSSAPL